MTENSDQVYRELQEHLDKMPIGYPPTKSGVEIRILKHIFTPEQARLAMNLDWKWSPLEEIHASIKEPRYPLEELERTLDGMIKRGGLNFKVKNGKKYHANAPIVVGIYEYQLSKLTPSLVKDFFHYIKEAFGFEIISTKINQLRTIPVEQSIENKKHIAIYEDIQTIILNSNGPIAVAECICKKGRDLIGRPCKITNR
ncbi:MAG: hypothetical protein ACTSYC_11855 [Promethearchaeota archaeon]